MKTATVLKFGYHALRMRLDRNYRRPLTTALMLLWRCPFRCTYCPQDHTSNVALSLDTIRGIMREARALGGLRIHLTGGEPLLRDDLVDIVALARELGFFVSLTTNGFRAAEQLPALRLVNQVQLSFDGPDDVRARLGGPLASATGLSAIECFRAHNIPFWLVTVLTRLNIPHIEWLLDFAAARGTAVSFAVMQPLPDEWKSDRPVPEHIRPILPSNEENRQAIQRLIELKKKGAPVAISLAALKELLAWPDYARILSPGRAAKYRCLAWQSHCEVFPNGDLHTCNWTMHQGKGISVLEGGFEKAWRRLPRAADCRSCIAPCHLESNLLFNLHPGTVFNWLRQLR